MTLPERGSTCYQFEARRRSRTLTQSICCTTSNETPNVEILVERSLRNCVACLQVHATNTDPTEHDMSVHRISPILLPSTQMNLNCRWCRNTGVHVSDSGSCLLVVHETSVVLRTALPPVCTCVTTLARQRADMDLSLLSIIYRIIVSA